MIRLAQTRNGRTTLIIDLAVIGKKLTTAWSAVEPSIFKQ